MERKRPQAPRQHRQGAKFEMSRLGRDTRLHSHFVFHIDHRHVVTSYIRILEISAVGMQLDCTSHTLADYEHIHNPTPCES